MIVSCVSVDLALTMASELLFKALYVITSPSPNACLGFEDLVHVSCH